MVSRERLSDHASRLEYYIGEHPWESIVFAIGAGMVVALRRSSSASGDADRLAREMARIGERERLPSYPAPVA